MLVTQDREGGGGGGYGGEACLCWVHFSNSPVLGGQGWLLDPGLHQHTLILALLVQPLMAVKHVANVCCQMQHVNIPAIEPHKLHASGLSESPGV